jgi:hypothetical protein
VCRNSWPIQGPTNLAREIKAQADEADYRFAPGLRHSTEVDYRVFRRDLAAELRKAGIDLCRTNAA